MTRSESRDGAGLSAQQEEQLCRLIRQRTGIRIHDHQLAGLRETAAQALRRFGFADADAYLGALQHRPSASPEMEHLIGGITVGESYFFRDEPQFGMLYNRLLPELIARKRASGDLSLRIWSAGCAGGQEIYSLAILLHELLPDIDRWTLRLLATDINTDALRQAAAGRYSQWSLRATPERLRERYFRESANGQVFEVLPELRGRVRFAYLNLLEGSYPSFLNETFALDLVLCRNVFIYLAPEVMRQAVERFSAALAQDGVLMLGPSDILFDAVPGLALQQAAEVFFYQCMPDDQAGIVDPPADSAPEAAILGAAPLEASTDRIQRLLRDRRWAQAVDEADRSLHGGTAAGEVLYFKAQALANLGNLAGAAELCAQSIAQGGAEKHLYRLYGMVLIELGRHDEAEAALRQALQLDPQFVEAHYQLGLLLWRLGRKVQGLHCLREALAIAERGDREWKVHDSSGVTYARFAQVLREELEVFASNC